MGIKQRKLENWMDERHQTNYEGKKFVDVGEVHEDNLPQWARVLLSRSAGRAKASNIEFSLSNFDMAHIIVESDGKCAVTGIKLRLDAVEKRGSKKHIRPWAPSIDRIDSSKGYSIENCRLVCAAANIAMGAWGEEVLLTMAKSIAKIQTKTRIPAPKIEWLTVKQYCQWRIDNNQPAKSEKTIRRWIKQGILKARHDINGRSLIPINQKKHSQNRV